MGLVTRQYFVALAVFGLLATTLAVSPATAQDNYTPQTPIGKMAQSLNPANWKMPQFKMPTLQKILPGQSEKDRIIDRKNGLVDEVKGTAMRSWTKTKETLNPMRLIPGFMGGGQAAGGGQQPVQQSGGFFSSLLGTGGQPVEPAGSVKPVSGVAGVNDFLNMNKPRP